MIIGGLCHYRPIVVLTRHKYWRGACPCHDHVHVPVMITVHGVALHELHESQSIVIIRQESSCLEVKRSFVTYSYDQQPSVEKFTLNLPQSTHPHQKSLPTLWGLRSSHATDPSL